MQRVGAWLLRGSPTAYVKWIRKVTIFQLPTDTGVLDVDVEPDEVAPLIDELDQLAGTR